MIKEIKGTLPSALRQQQCLLALRCPDHNRRNCVTSEDAIGQVTRLKRKADEQKADRVERLGPSSVPSLPTIVARWTLGI